MRYEPDNQNYNNNTDWVDEVTRHGWTNDHYLTVSGGGERAAFRTSGGYYDQKGTVMGQRYQRFSTRSQLVIVSDRMVFGSEFQFTYSDNDRNYENLLDIAYKKMPNMAVYEENADGSSTGRYYNMDAESGFNKRAAGIEESRGVGQVGQEQPERVPYYAQVVVAIRLFNPEEHYLRYLGWVAIDLNNERKRSFYRRNVCTMRRTTMVRPMWRRRKRPAS